VNALELKTIYNPFTRQLDYYRSSNFSGENMTVGNKIDFALGAIIDNLISGYIRITGGLIVTGDILANNYLNSSGSKEWIGPENIFDVDKADIEGDLNTFVDVAGDTMEGNLNMSSHNITSVNCIKYISGGMTCST
jgi:hypothetical protein